MKVNLKQPGIYKITNTVNGKFYFGSSKNVGHRFNQHRSALRRGVHKNPILQNSYNKHGREAFEYKPFVFCKLSQVLEMEQILLDLYAGQYDICFNVGKNATRPMLGRVVSKETRDKIGNANRGKKRTEDVVQGQRDRMAGNKHCLGYKHTKETRAKMVASRIGFKHSLETRAKQSKWLNKPVEVVWPDGKTQSFMSIKSAAEELGCSRETIHNRFVGQVATCGKFKGCTFTKLTMEGEE